MHANMSDKGRYELVPVHVCYMFVGADKSKTMQISLTAFTFTCMSCHAVHLSLLSFSR